MDIDNITIDKLYGSIVRFNREPYVIRYEDEARKVYRLIKEAKEIHNIYHDEDISEFAFARSRLGLAASNVINIYRVISNNPNSNMIICLKKDIYR